MSILPLNIILLFCQYDDSEYTDVMHEEDVRHETREFSNITIKAYIDQISQDVANHGKT